MCEYCKNLGEVDKTNKTLHDEKFNSCNIEIFIESDGSLCVNTYNHEQEIESFVSDICVNIDIKYCPMCGKEINV